ncbi:MAG: GNAT family N-acetyltransferase [Opitutae bacterium]|nr:GNAT family N-acetyltransferase [Opitutae bacterium]
MTLSIRPATRADVPLICEFIRGLAEYEKLLHECEATDEQLARTLFPADGAEGQGAGGAAPAAHVVIGEIDGTPAGFALYFFNYSTFLAKPGLYLEDLFVLPAHRGSGLGKALLLHLAKIANARGCGRMEWSVLDWNQPAIGFYRKIGAVPLNEWTVQRLTGPALAQYA